MTLIDVLDEKGNKTGEKYSKNEIHEKGLWHASAHIWFYNKKGEIFFQKRALVKDSHAGLFDITAAGHIDSGETPSQAALREIAEEVGLELEISDLEYLGVFKSESYIPDAKWHNKEFYNVYLYNFEGDPKKLVLQTEEVETIIGYNLDDLITSREYQNKDFVPHKQDHFEFVFKNIQERL